MPAAFCLKHFASDAAAFPRQIDATLPPRGSAAGALFHVGVAKLPSQAGRTHGCTARFRASLLPPSGMGSVSRAFGRVASDLAPKLGHIGEDVSLPPQFVGDHRRPD